MKSISPYADARLVALYDADNPDGPDRDFYRSLATGIGARRILDLGCGTGLLTRTLMQPGRTVVGIDPSQAMLDFGSRQYGDGGVSWITGDAGDVPGQDADLAIMTANVAQVFLTDQDWDRALSCLRGALRSGGMLAFESRNPAVAAWRKWTKDGTHRRRQTAHGALVKWVENTRERDGTVSYDAHYVFEETGEHLLSAGRLRFRSAEEIQRALTENGFVLRHLYGDWTGGPFLPTSPVMIFLAEASPDG